MNTYASVALIKSILGIMTDSKDVLLRVLANSQKEVLDSMLKVSGLEERTITDERQKPYGNELYFYVDEFNPSVPTEIKDIYNITILSEQLQYMEVDGGYSRKIHIRYPIPYNEFKVTYDAGYIINSSIRVVNFNNLLNKFIQIGETTLNEGVDFNRGASDEEAATNISNALTQSGYESTASGDTVNILIPDEISSDAEGSPANAIIVTRATLPYNIRTAFAYLVGGALAEREGIGNLSSYTLGSKTVNFRTDSERDEFDRIIKKYASQFNKTIIVS